MNHKIKLIFILLMIILCVMGFIISKKEESKMVDVTQNEMSGDNLETKIVLYFSNPETGELTKEYRIVNLSSIKEDAAGTIMKELLKGPSERKFSKSHSTRNKDKFDGRRKWKN